MNPGKLQSSKQRGQDGGWRVDDRAHFLFCTRTLCIYYVIAMLLLVSNHLCVSVLLWRRGKGRRLA